ncbi:MAG: carbohydrate ABC transporter permease [Lachnospiraceae bacterium]|nr:carbohydrate ABC transporter permease [Lachnospiraceae bacterium]
MRKIRPTTNFAFSMIAVLLSVLTVVPLLFAIIISFSSEVSIAKKGYSFIPSEWSVDSYRYLMASMDSVGRAFGVSVAVTVIGTILSLWLIGTMAFVLSRKEFPLRRLYTVLIMIPMFFSGGLVASYVVNTQLFGLKNSFLALILPQACSSWYIIVMRTYFRDNIPNELIDAAKIDGAGIFRIFFDIVIPLGRPIFAAVGIFEAFAYWNSWYYAMLYIRPERKELYPLQYLLYSIQQNAENIAANDNISGAVLKNIPAESFRMAVVVIITLPILLAYPLVRRHFTAGMLTGAVKE